MSQPCPDWRIVGVAGHHELVLLGGCQLRCQLGDDLFALWAQLPTARREQQIAVDRVPDRALQPFDLLLVGGDLRLKLLILRLELLVVTLPNDASRQWYCRQHDGEPEHTVHFLFPM